MARIVIFGASGYAGSAIAKEALARGHEVVAVARDASKIAAAEGSTAVAGDAFDASFVRQVSTGADVVVVALHAEGGDGTRLADAMPAIERAAADAGARLGIVGGAGSLLVAEGGPRLVDTPEFPAGFAEEARSHAAVLDALRAEASPADWFYVSPAAMFGGHNPGERRGAYRTTDEVLIADEAGVSDISGADYAIAFVDEIERPAHHRARFGVAY